MGHSLTSDGRETEARARSIDERVPYVKFRWVVVLGSNSTRNFFVNTVIHKFVNYAVINYCKFS